MRACTVYNHNIVHLTMISESPAVLQLLLQLPGVHDLSNDQDFKGHTPEYYAKQWAKHTENPMVLENLEQLFPGAMLQEIMDIDKL